MLDLKEKSDELPALADFSQYVQNPLFDDFCHELMTKYQVTPSIQYSGCSMAKGWNVKFKKPGKNLCTVYPFRNYFCVLVVVGRKEKGEVEEFLPKMSQDFQEIYASVEEGMNQRWLMVDCSEKNECYGDLLTVIEIRRNAK